MAWDKDLPAASTSLKSSNPQMLENNSSLETANNREHEFVTGGTVADQMHHKKGSARAFFQDAAPATRVDGTAFTSEDLGSFWFDSNSSPDNAFSVLTATTPTWTPVSTEIIAVAVAAIHTWAAVQTFSEIPVFTKGLAANDAFLQGRNNAGSGNVDLLKANTSDQATFGVNVAAFTMAAAIAMGSNKITGLADGTASGDALHLGQYTPTAEADAAGSDGVTVFPNGLRIARGSESVANGAEDTISPSGFTACYKASISIREDNTSARNAAKIGNYSGAQFTIRNMASVTLTIDWWAIGR